VATLEVGALERTAAPAVRSTPDEGPTGSNEASAFEAPAASRSRPQGTAGAHRLLGIVAAAAVVATMWGVGRAVNQPSVVGAAPAAGHTRPPTVMPTSADPVPSKTSTEDSAIWYIPPLRVMTYHDAVWIAYHPKWYARALRHQREQEAQRRAIIQKDQPPPLGFRRPLALR
jgi:hypothetical protein